MYKVIDELLLEFSETGDPALDQQIQDIRRKYSGNPDAAQQQIDRLKQQRMQQVSSRLRTLMLRKQQFNDQIDKQIDQERKREQSQSGQATNSTTSQ